MYSKSRQKQEIRDFWLQASEKVNKSSPQKATIKLNKIDKNNGFSTLETGFKGLQLERCLPLKTAEFPIRTVGTIMTVQQ